MYLNGPCIALLHFEGWTVNGQVTHSLTHCCAWPAEGRGVLHIERSWPAIQAAPTSQVKDVKMSVSFSGRSSTTKCSTTVPLLSPYFLEVEKTKFTTRTRKCLNCFAAVTLPCVVQFTSNRLQTAILWVFVLAVPHTADFCVINALTVRFHLQELNASDVMPCC